MENIPVVLVGPLTDHYGMASLAVSLLKASLKEQGIKCKSLYANMIFYETCSLRLTEELLDGSLNNLLYERLFAPFAYGSIKKTNLKGLNGDEIPEYLAEFYQVIGGVNRNISQPTYSDMERCCERFLEKAVKRIAPLRPRIIGFSNAYQHTNPSIALAKELKQDLPDTIFVIGGNNCEGEMGEEIASSIGIFDFVFQGEADFAFPAFCYDYLENNILPNEKVIRCSPTHDLDAPPVPDYSDFFEQCHIPFESVTLSFESSRGCWWGHKNQCKFCSESALSTAYRSKTPQRVVNELCQIQNAHPDIRNYFATDSIFPRSFYEDFMHKLAHSDFCGEIVYETNPKLSYDQIRQMKESGITRIFPGIESLSTRLLILMNKGTTALTNIRLLRDCRELNVIVSWLFLVGIPHDRKDDYEKQLKIMPLIQHFSPPRMTPIRIQRSSPYFREAESHEITEIKPIKAYEHAFPKSVDITRLAYYFVARYPSYSRQHAEILVPLKRQLDRWEERWRQENPPKLSMLIPEGGHRIVEDTRDCAKTSRQALDDNEYTLLKQCRAGISSHHLQSLSGIERLLDLGYLVEVDGKLLSLVCDQARTLETKQGGV